jgi:hypothetical protein
VFQGEFNLYVSGSFTLNLSQDSFQRAIWYPRGFVSFLNIYPSLKKNFFVLTTFKVMSKPHMNKRGFQISNPVKYLTEVL